MTTEKNVGRQLWLLVVLFISYLLIGSFVVGRNYIELIYLIILYLSIFVEYVLRKTQ